LAVFRVFGDDNPQTFIVLPTVACSSNFPDAKGKKNLCNRIISNFRSISPYRYPMMRSGTCVGRLPFLKGAKS